MFKKTNTYFIILLALHVVLSYSYIANRDIAWDEPQYIEYAKRWMHGKPERVEILDDSKTPLTVIAWAPRIFEQLRNKDVQYNDWGKSDQEAGRYMMVVFVGITALYIFLWARRMLGEKWSPLPVALFLFDPLVLGHSGIIGSDIASSAVYLAILFHLWRYLQDKKRKDFYMLSFLLGIACITKQNLVLLVFILPMIGLWHHLQTKSLPSFFSKKNILLAFAGMFIIWLVINAGFYFYGSFNTLGSYHFQSSTFIGLQQNLSFLQNCPLLLPQPFIRGFDMISYHAQLGGGKLLSTYDGVFVWGHESYVHGFWFYYLAMAFFKFPVPVLLVVVAGFAMMVHALIKKKYVVRTEIIVLLLPTLVFLFIMSCFNNFQIGIRHIIFMLPPLFLVIGLFVKHLAQQGKKAMMLMGALAMWQLLSIGTYFNNYIAYTNEFALNKTSIMNWVSDTSIDYGQNTSFVQKYINEHPGFRLPDSIPSTGKFAVRAIKVLNHNKQDPDRYAWLRQGYKPYGNYKGTIWLYDIKELR